MIRGTLWLASAAGITALGVLCYVANPASIPPYAFTVVNSGLALYAWRADPKRGINRVFAWMSFTVALWGADLVFLHLAPDSETAGRWVGVARLGLLLTPATIWHFAVVLTSREKGPLRASILAAYAGSCALGALSLGGWMGEGVQWNESRAMYVPQSNTAYLCFIVYELIAVPASLVLVLVAWARDRSPKLKKQYRLYVIGMTGLFILSSTNLVAPLGVDVFRHGYLGGVLFGVFFMYAIVRYRWLDLEFILRRALLYTTLSAGVVSVHLLSLLGASILLQVTGEGRSFAATVTTICIVAFAFAPARDALQNLLDRLFYRRAYDDRRLLRHLTDDVSRSVGIEAIARTVLSTLVDAMQLERASLVVRVPPPDGEPILYHHGASPPERNRPEDVAVLALLDKVPVILDSTDWAELDPLIGTLDPGTLLQARESLDRDRVRLAVPLIARERVLGALVLGAKRSELPFRSEEIQNFTTLANHVAVAIENSRLYEQILAARNYIEDVLRSMDDGLVTLDGQGRVVTANRAAERLLGRRGDQLVGLRYSEALETIPPFAEFARESLESLRGLARREIPWGERVLQARSTPLEGEAGGMMLLFEDVTARKTLEKRLELERRLATLGEMASQIAHEIRNPIASIRVWSDAAMNKIQDSEFREGFGRTVPPEVERLNRLVDDLLDYAKPGRLVKVPLSPAEIFESTLKLLEEDLKAKQVGVRRDYDPRAPQIEADGERLKQVILNLARNSIEAMAKSPRKELGVGVRAKDGVVELFVDDTGSGMDEGALERLYTPFFTTKANGTGLGLAIVHRIVEDHGWKISVQSKPNDGTRFTLACPLDGREAAHHSIE
ncbi:MAG TPA: ATP-binding protein [Planctomycetota bacterium]|nr:ATP-binding protein [Planctomycetota bacterium]